MSAEIIGVSRPERKFEALVRNNIRPVPVWSEPQRIDPSSWADVREIERRLDDGRLNVIDHADVEKDLAEMYDLWIPEAGSRTSAFKTSSATEGSWFLMDWSNELLHYPSEEDYAKILRYRDNLLTTPSEQQELYNKTILDAGMSVGRHIAQRLLQNGIGNTFILADSDTISSSNLNRLPGGVDQVGMAKVDAAAMEMSKKNPYIKLKLLREGVTPENIHEIGAENPDLVVDAVDYLPAKAALRAGAKRWRSPLVMATDVGYTSIIDIERYDDPTQTTLPFDGRIDEATFSRLAQWPELSKQEKSELTVAIVGMENISPRMLQSLAAIGMDAAGVLLGSGENIRLGGFPQLDTTAAQGGVEVANLARRLFLGDRILSGRQVIHQATVLDSLSVTE